MQLVTICFLFLFFWKGERVRVTDGSCSPALSSGFRAGHQNTSTPVG